MNISSQAFGYKQVIPKKYTCEGSNVNPPLMFDSMPGGTQSLALIMEDPDAPSGIYTHWVLYGMRPDTTSVPENGIPSGSMEGVNSSGHGRYDGPCPPSGTHRYVFRLYALDAVPNLSPSISRQSLESAMHGHIIAKADLVGLYQKTDGHD